jgi:hypothetical protein
MIFRVAVFAGTLSLAWGSAAYAVSLASHRAAYELSLADSASQGSAANSQAPAGARGLIAYEFRGSSCEGYASNYRLGVELDQAESGSTKIDLRSLTFEDGAGTSMRFEIETQGDQSAAPIAGMATRGAQGDVTVALTKPEPDSANLGSDLLFPTQHIERILEQAHAGRHAFEARVYDGSDTGKKVFQTLAVIGNEEPASDAAAAKPLAGHSRWPVTISYFDQARKDSDPDFIMSFDLYDNGITGDLKLDYGTYALSGRLAQLEMLPQKACAN